MQQTTPPQRSIRFTGRSFMAFVLSPQPPVAEWLEDFDSFAKRSPGFFAGRPVVVDIAHMPASRPELVHLVTELRRRHITIMGLDGRAPGELGADARGLPPILSGGKEIAAVAQMSAEAAAVAEPVSSGEAPAEGAGDAAAGSVEAAVSQAAIAAVEAAVEPGGTEALILDQPVRSGQSIVHLSGDVTVIGQVASGAEIIASGSIHVYGALRGRAIAGSSGDKNARIFCNALHAELIAINGLYKTNEDLERAYVGRAVHAWLDGDALKMAALSQKGQ